MGVKCSAIGPTVQNGTKQSSVWEGAILPHCFQNGLCSLEFSIKGVIMSRPCSRNELGNWGSAKWGMPLTSIEMETKKQTAIFLGPLVWKHATLLFDGLAIGISRKPQLKMRRYSRIPRRRDPPSNIGDVVQGDALSRKRVCARIWTCCGWLRNPFCTTELRNPTVSD